MNFEPSHPTVAAYATLRIAGDKLDPDYLTNLISLQPSEAWRKGDRVRLGKSETLVVKQTGMWLYRTSDAIGSNALSEHLGLLQRVLGITAEGVAYSHKALDVRAALMAFQLQLTASLFWHGRFVAAQPQVPAEFTRFIHFLGGRVVTDFESDEYVPASRLVADRKR